MMWDGGLRLPGMRGESMDETSFLMSSGDLAFVSVVVRYGVVSNLSESILWMESDRDPDRDGND